MADITRVSRFVGGLPRDVDLTTNTPQVLSLKVGTTTPAELTRTMVELLDTITNGSGLPTANLADGAVTGNKLASSVADNQSLTLSNAYSTVIKGAGSDLIVTLDAPTKKYASHFIPGSGATINVLVTGNVEIRNVAITGSVGLMTVEVYSMSGFDVGTLLGSASGAASNGTTYINFTSSPVTLSSTTGYYFVVSVAGTDVSNYVTLTGDAGVTWGNYYNGTSWSGGQSGVFSFRADFKLLEYALGLKDLGVTTAKIAAAAVTSTQLASSSVTSTHLTASAKQSTLESKLAALRVGILNFVPTTSSSSDTVTTEVLGAAATDTAVGAGAGVGAVNAKGIFVGTVSGAADIGKVLIRVNGTDNGFDDGSGDEIYGVLSEASGVYTLDYKKADGTAYTITASDTTAKMDLYFVEVFDLYSFGVDRFLMPSIGGVVDATTASSVYAESSAREVADSSLYAAVDAEMSDRIAADNLEFSARVEADSSLFAAVDLEYSARLAADSSLQTELDLTQGSLGDAISGTGGWLGFSGTNYLDAELTITASMEELDAVIYGESTTRLDADSSLYAAIDVEYSARLDADSSLYALVGSGSEADSSLYAAIAAEASVREDADSSLYAAIADADSSLYAAIADADSSLYAAIAAEASVREDADSSLYAAIADADSSLFAAIEAEASVRYEVDCSLYAALEEADSSLAAAMDVADSSLYAALDLEASTRYEVDSSLQVELDVTQGSIGDAMNGDGSWSGFSGTNYLDSELTITNSLIALDTAVYGESTARQEADSSLQSQIDALNVSVVDVQYTAATGGIAAGDVVALSLTVVGEVIKADATGIATCEIVVGVALETATAGNPVMVRTFGEASVTTDGVNFDLGKRVYSHTTAGQASKTPPSTSNNVVYLVGGATATDKVFVNTNLEYVVS